jgi:hypothetical protein
MSIYVHKMTHDYGVSPCTDNKLLSLAICSSRIRKHAKEGVWVFGFAAKKYKTARNNKWQRSNNHLIWCARITEKFDPPVYYTGPRYSNRLDCIYYRDPKGIPRVKPNAAAHASGSGLKLDISDDWAKGDWSKVYVLLSTDFWVTGSTSKVLTNPNNLAKLKRSRWLKTEPGSSVKVNEVRP